MGISTPLDFAMDSATVSWVTESDISKKQTKARIPAARDHATTVRNTLNQCL